jgi:hypothetical protein
MGGPLSIKAVFYPFINKNDSKLYIVHYPLHIVHYPLKKESPSKRCLKGLFTNNK